MEPELGAEVRHQFAVAETRGRLAPCLVAEVNVVGREHPAVARHEFRVLHGFAQPGLVDALQEGARVVAGGAPQARVESRKQRARLPVPGVAQVVGEFGKALEARRQARTDVQEVRCAWIIHVGIEPSLSSCLGDAAS